jgi:hypothetical protein
MSAIATPFAPVSDPLRGTRKLLHERMLNTGYSTRDIAKVESALLSVRLHDTYLQAGYSPDEIAAITSLY